MKKRRDNTFLSMYRNLIFNANLINIFPKYKF